MRKNFKTIFNFFYTLEKKNSFLLFLHLFLIELMKYKKFKIIRYPFLILTIIPMIS